MVGGILFMVYAYVMSTVNVKCTIRMLVRLAFI